MTRTRQDKKAERIVEAVRRDLEGNGAVDFLRSGGFALTTQGIARHLRDLGGRGRVASLIKEGRTNEEVLDACHPNTPDAVAPLMAPEQGSLFGSEDAPYDGPLDRDSSLFPTTRLTIRVPSDLYAALRLAAHAEKKSVNQVIVDTLTWAMSRLPTPVQGELEDRFNQGSQ